MNKCPDLTSYIEKLESMTQQLNEAWRIPPDRLVYRVSRLLRWYQRPEIWERELGFNLLPKGRRVFLHQWWKERLAFVREESARIRKRRGRIEALKRAE